MVIGLTYRLHGHASAVLLRFPMIAMLRAVDLFPLEEGLVA